MYLDKRRPRKGGDPVDSQRGYSSYVSTIVQEATCLGARLRGRDEVWVEVGGLRWIIHAAARMPAVGSMRRGVIGWPGGHSLLSPEPR